jgi:trk system potassium uptake protein TrkA
MVEEAVSVGDLVRLMTFRQSQTNLVELTLPQETPLAGKAVSDLDLPRDAALVTILRGDRVIVPTPDDPLEPGDELLFVATSDVEPQIRAALGY